MWFNFIYTLILKVIRINFVSNSKKCSVTDEQKTSRHLHLMFVFLPWVRLSSQLPCFLVCIYDINKLVAHAKILSHIIHTIHWWIKRLLIFQFGLIINNVIRGCYIIKLYNRTESIFFLRFYTTLSLNVGLCKQKIYRVVVDIVISIVFLMILS